MADIPETTKEWNNLTHTQQHVMMARAESYNDVAIELQRLSKKHPLDSDAVVMGIANYLGNKAEELLTQVGIDPKDVD